MICTLFGDILTVQMDVTFFAGSFFDRAQRPMERALCAGNDMYTIGIMSFILRKVSVQSSNALLRKGFQRPQCSNFLYSILKSYETYMKTRSKRFSFMYFESGMLYVILKLWQISSDPSVIFNDSLRIIK